MFIIGCGLRLWNTNEYEIEIMYFYYIIVKIYVLVCINMYSPIYFLCIIIMPQVYFYHELYTLTN
jgi:hypothetical protein